MNPSPIQPLITPMVSRAASLTYPSMWLVSGSNGVTRLRPKFSKSSMYVTLTASPINPLTLINTLGFLSESAPIIGSWSLHKLLDFKIAFVVNLVSSMIYDLFSLNFKSTFEHNSCAPSAKFSLSPSAKLRTHLMLRWETLMFESARSFCNVVTMLDVLPGFILGVEMSLSKVSKLYFLSVHFFLDSRSSLQAASYFYKQSFSSAISNGSYFSSSTSASTAF